MKKLVTVTIVFFFILLSAGITSCERTKLYHNLKQLTETKILIPSGIDQIVFPGCDSIDYKNKMAILVVYSDSLSCSSCRLKYMYEYKDLIDFGRDTLNQYSPAFILTPPNNQIQEVKQTIRFSGLDHAVLLDYSGLFPKVNPHIPEDNRFHTFLLDKNGKIVLVGDPTRNSALWELYKTTILQLIANNGTLPE